MSEFKGTPGPWTWYQPQSTASVNPYSAAFVLGPKRVPMDRSEGFTAADAKLIAAAPDLLEALKGMVSLFPTGVEDEGSGIGFNDNLKDKYRASVNAIAKALASNN